MSLVLKSVVVFPSRVMRSTVAGEPVAAYPFPALSLASAQMYVEGMVAVSNADGAAASEPSLEIATPCGRPFSHSSMCDMVQTLVPCAKQLQGAASRIVEESRNQCFRARNDMWLKSTRAVNAVL